MNVIRLAATALLLIAAATQALAQSKIILTPQWSAQAQFAGYYVAYELGFYKDAGLTVEIRHPSVSQSTTERLKSDPRTVATLQLTQAIRLVDEGVPLVNILQTSQQNMVTIVPRHNDIQTIEDLNGKRVCVPRAGFYESIKVMAQEHGLDIEWVSYNNDPVALFASGAVDATWTMAYNERLRIAMHGFDTQNTIWLKDLGYDIPGDGLYATRAYYEDHKSELDRFAQASRMGWEWAAKHPDETIDIVMRWAAREHTATNREHQKQMLDIVLKAQCPEGKDAATFKLDRNQVKLTAKKLLTGGFIKKEITFEELTAGEEQ